MNQPYIPHSISAHLHTLVRAYPQSWKNIPKAFGTIHDFSDEPYGSSLISSNMIRKTGPAMPVILSLESVIAYAVVVLPGRNYLIGPVRFEEAVFLSRNMTLKSLNIEEGIDKSWLVKVPVCSFQDFAEQVLLLFNYRRKGNVSEPFLYRDQLFAANCVQDEIAKKSRDQIFEHVLDNLENQIVHNPYSQEQREMNSIREGNMRSLRKAIHEDFTGQYGILASDPLRQEKDIGIVTIALASRAAIEGGLHHEQAFYISDRTIQQLEAAADIPSVRHFYREAEYQLTELVHHLKETKKAPSIENRHVSRCKDYIMTHLHERLTVSQVAEEVGFDRSYISKLFSDCEHITMKDYITYEKIQLVKNMLTYSTYSYSRIAAYLGFASQSHLGAAFKKVTGMTLKAYRDANAKGDIFG